MSFATLFMPAFIILNSTGGVTPEVPTSISFNGVTYAADAAGLITLPAGVPVVEKGTTDGWDWSKYADGTYEARKIVEHASHATGTAAGALFRGASLDVGAYPIVFPTGKFPVCKLALLSNGDAAFIGGYGFGDETTGPSYYIYTPTSYTATYEVYIDIVGEWI